MRISKIYKKRGWYIICLENSLQNFTVSEEFLYRFKWQEGMEIEYNNQLKEFLEEDKCRQCLQIAARKLDFSILSEYELTKKLRQEGFEENTIAKVIEKLKEMKFIDDNFITDCVIKNNKNRNLSKNQIKNKLKQKGISQALWDEKVSESITEDVELDNARTVCMKKMKSLSGKTNDEIRKKLYYALSYRGFSYDVISKAVEQTLKEKDI